MMGRYFIKAEDALCLRGIDNDFVTVQPMCLAYALAGTSGQWALASGVCKSQLSEEREHSFADLSKLAGLLSNSLLLTTLFW